MEKTSYPKEIQIFFNEIILRIREVLDPDFILIAGSFGKESWLYSNGNLISDFELVFVCSKKWSFKNKKRLLMDLNTEYPYEISLKGYLKDNVENKVISNYAFKNPGYISLDFFDTFYEPKYIYNKNNEVLDLKCSVDEIPVWEAWRLYVNRMGDLLEIECSENITKQTADYFWLKIFESTADAYCIINKNYQKNISNRVELFNEKLINADKELTESCKNSFPLIQKALLARNAHDLSIFENNFNYKDCKVIINSWMRYFENKLAKQEKIIFHSKEDFYFKYLNSSALQSKYFGFNYRVNIFVSNLIRLIHNPILFSFKFRFLNHKVSWRHVILVIIANLYNENNNEKNNLPISKNMLEKLISKKYLKNQTLSDLIATTIYYWKTLR